MAISEYIPTQWVDNAAPAINAANLNHIEQGIKANTDTIINDILPEINEPPYELPGATPTKLGGIRVEVVDNGDGTYTGKIWTSE